MQSKPTSNPTLNLAPFGRWTLRNEAAQLRLASLVSQYMTMRYDYLKETPRWMIAVLVVVCLFAILPIANLIVVGYKNLKIGLPSDLNLGELGQLGDFFGGHTSAFAGSLSLVVVLFFTFHRVDKRGQRQ